MYFTKKKIYNCATFFLYKGPFFPPSLPGNANIANKGSHVLAQVARFVTRLYFFPFFVATCTIYSFHSNTTLVQLE